MNAERCTCTRGPDWDGPEPTCPVHGCPVCIVTGGPHRQAHDGRLQAPDYVVIRPAADLPTGFLPPELDGTWFDRAQLPRSNANPWRDGRVGLLGAVAVPSGRFEYRDDGAVAEVWEIRP